MVTPKLQNTSNVIPATEDIKTKIIPPDMAVRIAWGLTTQLSENKSVQLEANRVKDLMRDVRNKAEDSKNEMEKRYVNCVCAAIEATYRNLVTITNGRNLNFADVGQLRNIQIEKINQNSQFTTNLQSSIPRISGMTFGGVGVSILFTKFLPIFDEKYFLPLLAIGAAIGYMFNGYYIIPRTHKKIQIQKIKLDYDRNLYYKLYVNSSKEALKALYNSADRYHKNIFYKFYYSGNDRPEVDTIIDEVLGGISSKMCMNVSKCTIGDIVTLDKWSICETGLGIENCPNNK